MPYAPSGLRRASSVSNNPQIAFSITEPLCDFAPNSAKRNNIGYIILIN